MSTLETELYDRFVRNRKLSKARQASEDASRREALARRVAVALLDPKNIESVKDDLETKGWSELPNKRTGLPCMCEGGGFCDWERGFRELEPFLEAKRFWNDRGVTFCCGCTGIEFRLMALPSHGDPCVWN